jgi:hypothetical protein
MYTNLTPDMVDGLYSVWGGKARYVLEKAELASLQDMLSNAISNCDLSVLACLDSAGHADDISDK